MARGEAPKNILEGCRPGSTAMDGAQPTANIRFAYLESAQEVEPPLVDRCEVVGLRWRRLAVKASSRLDPKAETEITKNREGSQSASSTLVSGVAARAPSAGGRRKSVEGPQGPKGDAGAGGRGSAAFSAAVAARAPASQP